MINAMIVPLTIDILPALKRTGYNIRKSEREVYQTRYGNSYFMLLEVEYANSSLFSNVRLQRIVTP
ncbi:hypothetical protein FHR29_001908 [Sphingobacterium sp. JUb56]|nr:hypothetical protein [Sphingobacterium sp. JUb56]